MDTNGVMKKYKIKIKNPVMGVPITFLYKYNPKQFEILDLINRYMIFDYFGVNEEVRKKHSHCANVNGKSTYARILIKKIQQG